MVYGWEGGLNRDARVIDKALWERGSLGLDETSVMRCADARGSLPPLRYAIRDFLQRS